LIVDRITQAHLEAKVGILNRMLGRPEAPYLPDGPMMPGSGHRYVAQVGNLHLDGAYGGWRVDVMGNLSGGVHTLWGDYCTKREAADRLSAMIAILREAERAI
jgi:hypothetical protein